MHKPAVSVVIPAYNAAEYLQDAVNSVLGQTTSDWEMAIVDDGSTDSTAQIGAELAASDPRITFYTQANSGVSVARNLGLTATSAPLLLFLDSDDYLFPEALERLTVALDGLPNAPMVYGCPRQVGPSGTPITKDVAGCYGYRRVKVDGMKLAVLDDDAPTPFESLVVWPCIATPGQALVRRSAAVEAGLFDPELRRSQDWEFWIRLSLLGSLPRLSEFVLNKRVHSGSVTKDGKGMAFAEPLVRRKVLDLPGLTPDQRRIARIGHLLSCRVKLGWAADNFRKDGAVSGLKQAFRALRSYWRWVRASYATGQRSIQPSAPVVGAHEPDHLADDRGVV